MDEPLDAITFRSFALHADLIDAVEALGITEPTPIQVQTVPAALDRRDLIGLARTGSGKTLAFALPLLQQARTHEQRPSALVITPTRELALQITEVFRSIVPKSAMPIVGGTPYAAQRKALARSPSIIVGTPGRLRDLHARGDLVLANVHSLVLDEADEMLRMGFQDDVEYLVAATRPERQVLLFSATMPEAMAKVADKLLRDPVTIQVEDQALTVHHIDQCWLRVPTAHKLETLHHLLAEAPQGTVLIFASTRVGCVDLADQLTARGLPVDRLHGGLDQPLRERVLARVREGKVDVLVATDVAARGIDIAHIGLVVNYDLPESDERYVHRIGRTARAGRPGTAVTFVTPKQKRRLHELAQALGVTIRQGEIPGAGGIARRQRAALVAEVSTSAATPSPEALALVDALQSEHGLSPRDLAAAALQLLATQRGLALDPAADDVVPDWVVPVPTSNPWPQEHREEVQLTVFLGKEAKVTASAFVAALDARGITRNRVGRIRIGKRQTQIGLPQAAAEALLTDGATLLIAGNPVAMALAD
jgi:ATP-dependent RNA helicase DeaD